jgi:hypothetical protein
VIIALSVAILRKGDLEQFGIYVCKYCGTTFKSIGERVIHERIHYFIIVSCLITIGKYL